VILPRVRSGCGPAGLSGPGGCCRGLGRGVVNPTEQPPAVLRPRLLAGGREGVQGECQSWDALDAISLCSHVWPVRARRLLPDWRLAWAARLGRSCAQLAMSLGVGNVMHAGECAAGSHSEQGFGRGCG